jgi:hypothetical protein
VLIVGGIMEFAKHGTTVAPYVVQTLRRYILGPEAIGPVKLGRLQDESAGAQDLPAQPLDLDSSAAAIPDSAPGLGDQP